LWFRCYDPWLIYVSLKTPFKMKTKIPKTPQEIIDILHSIKDVKFENGEVWVKFQEESTTFSDGWEPNAGFIYNSFTRNLLDLIEDELSNSSQ